MFAHNDIRNPVPSLFRTRAQARKQREKDFGYIRGRPDLLGPPNNWTLPRVVKVLITVEEI